MSRNNNSRNGRAKWNTISPAEMYHHPVLFDRRRKNGISSGRFPIHTSIIWENEVYDQNRVRASIRLPMSIWNFGRRMFFSGGFRESVRNRATQKHSAVSSWFTE